MKRLLSLFLCGLMIISAVTAVPLPVLADSESEYGYTVALGQATIEEYNGSDTDIEIPSVIDGYIVTGIGSRAFLKNTALTSVVLPSGVKTIGDYAFEYCSSLTSVTLSESLTTVGGFAFGGCSSLQSLSIPAGVTSIGIGVLDSCSSLTAIDVNADNLVYNSQNNCNAIIKTTENKLIAGCQNTVIPDSVTTIEMYAFRGCTGLTELVIPDSVTSIGGYAFSGCTGLTALTLPSSITGISYRCFYGCTGLTHVFIPDSVTNIETYAFYGCTGLTEAVIPSGVTAIGNNAFRNCTGITYVTLPAGLTTINANAFNGCSSLKVVNVIGEADDYFNITIDTGNNALNTAEKRYYPERYYTYTVNDGVATVTGYSGPESVLYIPVTLGGYRVTGIGSEAFAGCTNITTVNIPDYITAIGAGAFKDCTGINTISVSPDNPVYDSRENSNAILETAANTLIAGCKSTVVPESVTAIGKAAFDGCMGLSAIYLYDNLTAVGEAAFRGCTNLKTVYYTGTEDAFNSITVETANEPFAAAEKIYNNGFSFTVSDGTATVTGYKGTDTVVSVPAVIGGYTVTGIGDNAFVRSTKLTGITLPDSVTVIGDDAFAYCSRLTEITIPAGVTAIGEYAFYACSGLTGIEIPASVTAIGTGAFDTCRGLTDITVSPQNTVYDSRDNCKAIIETATNTLILGCQNTVIPDSVTAIGQYAFRNCTGLSEITLPDSITTIDSLAFYGCTGLTEIAVPDGVSELRYRVFADCTGLTEVTLPDTVTVIGEDAFYNCTSLTNLTLPERVTEIGDFAFYRCENLPSVALPESVTGIGASAFYGCQLFTEITVPRAVASIGASAFSNCTGVTAIAVDAQNTVYDSRDNCNAIIDTATNTLLFGCRNTVIPDSVTYIGNDAFKGCADLAEITVPDGVTGIGDSAFRGCSALREITLPASVTALDSLAFYGCSSLESITFYDSLTDIEIRVFDGCRALTTVNYIGTKEAFEQMNIGMINTPFVNAVKHYFAGREVIEPTCTSTGERTYYCSECDAVLTVELPMLSHSYTVTQVPSTANERGYVEYVCSVCGTSYRDDLPYASDDSVLTAVIAEASALEQADYDDSSYAALMTLVANSRSITAGNNAQNEIDEAAAAILDAVSALVPYLNLWMLAENGTYSITVDEEFFEHMTDEAYTDVKYGSLIELTASPNSGYVFKGWYETTSHRIFSTEKDFDFTLTSNTTLQALFVPENTASVYFMNDSGYIKAIVTKTCEDWSAVTESDMQALMPPVPYRFGSEGGQWVSEADNYLALLQQGRDVVFTAAYTDTGRPQEDNLPPVNENGVPNLQLSGSYDRVNNVYTYVMGAGISEQCSVVSVGIAFSYGKRAEFNPNAVYVTLSNKMLTSKFEATPESGYYIVNVKHFNWYNWAARGYVTYYDSYGTLKTAYSGQLNVVN